MTLVELLVVMVILGVIIAAVGNALVVGFTTTNDTSQRFSESHDAQIASATLAKDVQSAHSITNATNASCGPGALISFSSDGATPAVSYYYGTGSNGETQITRSACNGSGTQVMAHFAAVSGPPTVTCDGLSCDPSDPTKSKPDIVKILVTEKSGYAFTLLGARRTTDKNPQPAAAKVNVLVLAIGGVGGPGLSIGGSASGLIIHGSLYVNSSSPTAVSVGGCTDCLNVRDTAKILAGGLCSGCNGSNSSPPYPSGWGSYPTPIPDPLQYLPYPSKAGLPVYTDGSYHGPGVYTTTLQIKNTVNLQSGIYILERGMAISANGTTVTGSGVMLFNTCANTGSCGGTDLGGSVTVSGHSSLTLTPPTGLYDGVLIFQDRTNTQIVSLTGQSAVSSLQGTIYAPTSQQVTLSAGGAGMNVYSVIASSLAIGGGSKVTIGPM